MKDKVGFSIEVLNCDVPAIRKKKGRSPVAFAMEVGNDVCTTLLSAKDAIRLAGIIIQLLEEAADNEQKLRKVSEFIKKTP